MKKLYTLILMLIFAYISVCAVTVDLSKGETVRDKYTSGSLVIIGTVSNVDDFIEDLATAKDRASTVDLEDVVFPGNVIPSNTCNGFSAVYQVFLPRNTTAIGDGAFQNCVNLYMIRGFNEGYKSASNVRAPITSIGAKAFDGCDIGNNSTVMGDYLDDIDLSNVTKLGEGAFRNNKNIKTVRLNDGLTAVPDNVFEGCISLFNVGLPPNAVNIGPYAFDNTGLTAITIPVSVVNIGVGAFRNTKLSAVNFMTGSKIEEIGDHAFEANEKQPMLTSVNLNICAKLRSIGTYAFSGQSKLTSIDLPNSVADIGEGAFAGCSGISNIQFPNNDAFNVIPAKFVTGAKDLTRVEIPGTVVTIGQEAFAGDGLVSVNIPSSVKKIEARAFSENALGNIILNSATPPDVVDGDTGIPIDKSDEERDIFANQNGDKDLSITIPEGESVKQSYAAHDYWGKYFSDVVVSIDEIDTDDDSDEIYYDLNGIRISSPKSGNIYIVKKGTRVYKISY